MHPAAALKSFTSLVSPYIVSIHFSALLLSCGSSDYQGTCLYRCTRGEQGPVLCWVLIEFPVCIIWGPRPAPWAKPCHASLDTPWEHDPFLCNIGGTNNTAYVAAKKCFPQKYQHNASTKAKIDRLAPAPRHVVNKNKLQSHLLLLAILAASVGWSLVKYNFSTSARINIFLGYSSYEKL